MKPISFLVEHYQAVYQAYREAEGRLKGAWGLLCERLPEIEQAMKLNIFKVHVPVVVAMIDALPSVSEVRQLQFRIRELEEQIEFLEEELKRYREPIKTQFTKRR
jgi:hypothetical protein